MVAFSDFNRYFRLFQSVTAFAFHSASLSLFLSTAKRIFKGDMLIMLKLFLLVWIIEDLTALPYGAFNAVFWRPTPLSYYYDVALWTVIWERSVSCGIPVMVFFLTVDRCLAIAFGLHYKKRYGYVIGVMAATIVTTTTSVTLLMYIAPQFMDPEEDDNGQPPQGASACMDTVCFFEHPDDWQFLVRVSFGTLNFLCSILLFGLLRHQNAKRAQFTHDSKQKSAGNAFTLYAITSELLLNFLPHASCLVYEMVSGVNISRKYGTYSRFVTSIDALVCAVMYRRVRRSVSPQTTAYTPNHPPPAATLKRGQTITKVQAAKRPGTAIPSIQKAPAFIEA